MLREWIFKIKEGGTRLFYIRINALAGFPFRGRIRGYRVAPYGASPNPHLTARTANKSTSAPCVLALICQIGV